METENKFPKDLSMPRFSWDFDRFSESEHWFLHAEAYLEASCLLLKEMTEGRTADSFHHAKVAMATFEHAIELFLKGMIMQAGRDVPMHHHVDQLLQQVRGLYPGKRFAFTGKIDEAASGDPRWPPSQFARYPVDSRGQHWKNAHIDLALWRREVEPFTDDFARIKKEAFLKYPDKGANG